MAKQRWGKETRVKYLGGELSVSLNASKAEIDLVKDLNGVIARGTNMSEVMEEIGLYLLGVTAKNFKAEGRPKWAPLKPATIADRIRKGYGPKPILQRTKKLVNSLTVKGSPYQVFQARPRSLVLASRVPYFEVHQRGGKNIPKRAMLTLQGQEKRQITAMINKFIKGGVF